MCVCVCIYIERQAKNVYARVSVYVYTERTREEETKEVYARVYMCVCIHREG